LEKSKYGRFIENGKVFEIDTPYTPAPWKNYLFNKEYVTYVSQCGQGDSVNLNPLTSWINRGNIYFYVRDNDKKTFFATLHTPVEEELDSFKCRHGIGCTEIITQKGGIEVYHRVFVPLEGEREIWTLKIRNLRATKAELSFFTYLPIHGGDSGFGITTQYDKETGIVISSKIPYFSTMNQHAGTLKQKNATAVFPDKKPDYFDCSDSGFMGIQMLPRRPESVIIGQLNSSMASNEPSCAAYQYNMQLNAGEEFEVNIFMQASDLINDKMEIIKESYEKSIKMGDAENEMYRVNKFWDEAFELSHVETPDDNFNHTINYWAKKQLYMMAYTHRLSTGPCIRNDIQDMQGLSLFDKEFAIESLDRIFSFQKSDGYLQRNLVLNDMVSLGGIAVLNYKDAALWLPLAIATLIKQTGDLSYLDKKIAFKNSDEIASVKEHIRRSFEFSINDLGEHGIPHISEGDWDDPLNGPGRFDKGESTWLGMALIYAAKEYLPLVEAINDVEAVELLNRVINVLDENINKNCWDGKWYIRGFDDFGVPFGSCKDEEGQIFLNALSWAVLSGCTRGERLTSVLDVLDNLLDTECGPITVYPAFTKLVERIGKLSVKKAGTQENGSIYCHAATFKIMADCSAGRGNKAYETMTKLLGTNPQNPPDRSLQSPLFIPNYYTGPADSIGYGRSSQHEQTGSASWFMRIGLEHIVGLRADLAGLIIDPCLPTAWDKVKAKRVIKGVICNINIDNGAHVEKGIKQIKVNGKIVDSPIIALDGTHKEVNIDVVMG